MHAALPLPLPISASIKHACIELHRELESAQLSTVDRGIKTVDYRRTVINLQDIESAANQKARYLILS